MFVCCFFRCFSVSGYRFDIESKGKMKKNMKWNIFKCELMKDRYIWPSANQTSLWGCVFVAAVVAICQWQQHFQNHCQQKYFRNYQMNITWIKWVSGLLVSKSWAQHEIPQIQTNFIHWFSIEFIAFCLQTFGWNSAPVDLKFSGR